MALPRTRLVKIQVRAYYARENIKGRLKPVHRLSDDLSADSSLEAQINRALIGRDWKTLEGLLAQYKAAPDRDAVLYDYALGALRRSQLRHDEAVSLYRGILAKHPDLAYPRFDLGVMLFLSLIHI